MNDKSEWMTVSDAAKLTGYNLEYIRRLMRDGKIEARKFSIVWQVRRDSLMDYVKKNQLDTDKRRGPKSK
jgi:excisionase family DNA binding protein